MSIEDPEFLYNKYFSNLDFERLGLFECIKREFQPENVIYIGSSIHITPSFIFQNVTYIDKSLMAKEFFQNESGVKVIINSNKQYKLQPYVNFYNLDYLKSDIGNRYKYDVCMSIFTSNSLEGLEKYIKPGGILIFLPLSVKTVDIGEEFKYKGYIYFNKKYIYQDGKPSKTISREVSGNTIFRENNIYEVYIKSREDGDESIC